MNLKQNVYFMALVGALAGLGCWTTQVWLSDFVHTSGWLSDALGGTLMGAFIGGLTVGFADYWTSDRFVPSWAFIGAGIAAVAGCAAGLLTIPLSKASPTVALLLIWPIAGSLIGLVTGLRWVGANPLRAVHALAGGLVGGIGGGLLVAFGPRHEFVHALTSMLIGSGITLGVTLAPVLLSDGLLRFVSSGDPRAQNKYGSPRQEWVLQDGDRFVIGSQSADMTSTVWTQDIQVYIPDAMVRPRHALIFAKKKRFYVQLHPENSGPQGQPLEPLELDGANVVGTQELKNGDELVVGQTLLRFMTKRKQASQHEEPEYRPGRRAR